ncbi:MAG: Aspartate carbamoyltransferase [Parcubacteria group bacterium GW2011_GWA2_44_12]|nr:MAG: Aspartate carbamoyltransferase [Parcubacteria group bacterium GW2011_GWA2_44_12]
MKHLISIQDISTNEIIELIKDAGEIKKNPGGYAQTLNGKIIATLFFEPSTRTRLSFTSASLQLGAQVLGFNDAKSTSTAKGETIEDTIKIINGYCHLIVMRHSEIDALKRAAEVSSAPVINAGNGSEEHPTQTLLDLFTIVEKGINLEDVSLCFVGDLKYGRTVHSLSLALAHFVKTMYFVSPPSLRLPSNYKTLIEKQGVHLIEKDDLNEIAGFINVLYMTRVQLERFDDQNEYERLKLSFILNKKSAALFREDCLFMHPLPRIGEIDPEMDNDSRAIYFEQSRNGVWMRMALMAKFLA